MEAISLTFEVERFAPVATTKKDLDAFISEHEGQKHRLLIHIDPTGIGDALADHLESAGFAVLRKPDCRGR